MVPPPGNAVKKKVRRTVIPQLFLDLTVRPIIEWQQPITITDIKPGFVKTAMAKGDGIFWAASAEVAAMQIYRAIKRRRSGAYITRRWRMVAWITRLLPGFVYERL